MKKNLLMMKTGILTMILVIFCCGSGTAQNIQLSTEEILNLEFSEYFQGQDSLYSSATSVNINQDIFVCGLVYSAGTKQDAALLRYNSSGNLIWSKTYDFGVNGNDRAVALDCDAQGDVYVLCTSYNGSDYDLVVIKYKASNGQQQFIKRYDNGSLDAGVDIEIDGNGDVCVIGSSYGSGYYDYVTLKLNSNSGNIIWEKRHDEGNHDIAKGLVINNNNDIIVTGYSRAATGYLNSIRTIQYNSSGVIQWSKTYSNTVSSNDLSRDIAIDNSGDIYITGITDSELLTLCYNGNGVEKWVQINVDASYNSQRGESITTDNSNGVYILANSMTGNTAIFTTIKYKANNGTQEWIQHHQPEINQKNTPAKIITDSNNDVYLTGMGWNGNSYDMITIKYLNDGTEKFVEYFNGTGNGGDSPSDLAVDDANGAVYVVGQVYDGTQYSFATIKYAVTEVIIPPDVDYDEPSDFYIYNTNGGQLLNTDGNTATDIRFYNTGTNPALYIGDNTISYVFSNIADEETTVKRVDLTFQKGNTTKALYTEKVESDKNYYLPHIPQGVTGVKGYRRIVYPNIYDGIDCQFYSNSAGEKIYFIAKPGSDPESIYMKFEGANNVSVTPAGGLRVETDLGNIEYPRAYVGRTNPAGNIVPMINSGDFVIEGNNTVKVDIQNYPANSTVMIGIFKGLQQQQQTIEKRNLDWSTYYAGDNADIPHDITTDDNGNVFISGATYSLTFPVTNTQYFTAGSMTHAFVTKFDNQAALKWGTIIAGSYSQSANAITYNHINDHVYFIGTAQSVDFPIWPPTDPDNGMYYQNTNHSDHILHDLADAVIVSFDNVYGYRQWATYFGGELTEDGRMIATDESGNIYVAGHTYTSNGTTNNCNATDPGDFRFPLCPGSGGYYQASNAGGQDLFYAKFSPDNELLHSTFFGSTERDVVNDMVITGNSIYFVGNTESLANTTNCGVPTDGSFPLCDNGGTSQYFAEDGVDVNGDELINSNGFIARFYVDGTLGWSTLIPRLEDIQTVTVDDNVPSNTTVYVVGLTVDEETGVSTCQPSADGLSICDPGGTAYVKDHKEGYQLEYDLYIAAFSNEQGNPLLWSTFYGSVTNEYSYNQPFSEYFF